MNPIIRSNFVIFYYIQFRARSHTLILLYKGNGKKPRSVGSREALLGCLPIDHVPNSREVFCLPVLVLEVVLLVVRLI